MTRNRNERGGRNGFTMVELLVVIAIIAVLAGLAGAAVARVMIKIPETQCQSDIGNLTSAIGAFQQQFNVKYMPSQLVLRENGAYNMSNSLEADSATFLTQMFGKRLSLAGIDWNGDGAISTQPVTLTGDQCLVFFLGGIPVPASPYGCLGFSTNPVNPGTVGGTRLGPFFDFKTNRLLPGANGFFSYIDPFKTNKPYAYFSSYKILNGYNRYGTSDCASLNVSPYVQSTTPTTNYFNSGGVQIISAGSDGIFGAGGLLNLATGPTGNGWDDWSNFALKKLGVPQ